MRSTRSPRLRSLTFCAPTLAAAIAALMTGVAQAAPATLAAHAARAAHVARAARQPAASFGGQASLASVSCKGASWCMAVGSYTTTDSVRHSLAMIWTGTTWRTLKNPPGKSLTRVSCSSPRFCMASGGPTGAVRWNGTSWRTMRSPRGGLASITCAARTLCMRIHGTLVGVWNGRSWHDAKATDVCSGSAPGPCGMASVSCGSATNCIAVGTMTVSQEPVQVPIGMFWNGKTWARTEPPGAAEGNPAAANAVGCIASFCMAAGEAFSEVQGGGIAVAGTWTAAKKGWTDVSPDLGVLCTGALAICAWAGQVACGSTTSCMTLGGPPGSQFWNGSTWKSAKAIFAGRGSALRGLSCGGSDCLAVGFRTVAGKKRTLAELWNGSGWTIIKTPK